MSDKMNTPAAPFAVVPYKMDVPPMGSAAYDALVLQAMGMTQESNHGKQNQKKESRFKLDGSRL